MLFGNLWRAAGGEDDALTSRPGFEHFLHHWSTGSVRIRHSRENRFRQIIAPNPIRRCLKTGLRPTFPNARNQKTNRIRRHIIPRSKLNAIESTGRDGRAAPSVTSLIKLNANKSE